MKYKDKFKIQCVVADYIDNCRRKRFKLVTRGNVAMGVMVTLAIAFIIVALCIATGSPKPVLVVSGITLAIGTFTWAVETLTSYD